MDSSNGQHARHSLLIFGVGALHLRVLKECDKAFRQQGFPLEMDQIPVLAKLYYTGPSSQQEICSGLQRDKASVNRTVSFLKAKGIVRVVADATDKRKTRVELTESGKELGKQADAVVKKIDKRLTACLTAKEGEQFSALVNKLIESSFT